MNILIVKHGALGDVVRTSYFAKFIKRKYPFCQLDWFTAHQSIPLIEANPFIDNIVSDIHEIHDVNYDILYSLDDEIEIISAVDDIAAKRYVGAYLESGKVKYTNDVSEWFDMGIHSTYGINIADSLKKENHKSHGEIFTKIFDVETVEPNIYFRQQNLSELPSEIFDRVVIGINPFAGGRWKSKQLRATELVSLIRLIVENDIDDKYSIVLLGQGEDYLKNVDIIQNRFPTMNVLSAIDTTGELVDFMRLVGRLNYLITSDSLAMHLAIAQSVKTVAFFSPTSANEIDDFGCCVKVKSSLPDYCNYKAENDNSDITAVRIYKALTDFFS